MVHFSPASASPPARRAPCPLPLCAVVEAWRPPVDTFQSLDLAAMRAMLPLLHRYDFRTLLTTAVASLCKNGSALRSRLSSDPASPAYALAWLELACRWGDWVGGSPGAAVEARKRRLCTGPTWRQRGWPWGAVTPLR